MLRSLRAQAQVQRKAGEIYGAIVTQARQPDFYLNLAVPDTPVGRYELVVLHLFLVLERLRAGPDEGQILSRVLIETFVTDMDDSLRELGTGDLAVGRKVKRAAAGLYERSADYRAALAAADETELARALGKHLPRATDDADEGMNRVLARYMKRASAELAGLPVEQILSGEVVFPAVLTAGGEPG
jgi:cytochrome b pre-mRNA-processing protein 3